MGRCVIAHYDRTLQRTGGSSKSAKNRVGGFRERARAGVCGYVLSVLHGARLGRSPVMV